MTDPPKITLLPYATATIRKVRTHADEMGYIEEEAVLKGELASQDMRRLPSAEQAIVLSAMHQTFVERRICLREAIDGRILLIFPAYFKRKRPDQEAHPAAYVRLQQLR